MAARTRTAVGRNAQVQLADLKRVYRAAGFSEAEIHAVIPSRPAAARGTTEPTLPAPTPLVPAPTPGPDGQVPGPTRLHPGPNLATFPSDRTR